MEPLLRTALPEDETAIAAFTQGTFPWGDYVGRVFSRWLADPNGCTLVAEVGGAVVGLAHGALLSPAEAWSQGLRVHPEHRRRGLGAALLEHLAAWAGACGARVMRLSSEDWNSSARRLFEALHFRPAGAWLAAERASADEEASPRGNGGRRVPASHRLRPVPAAEADGAMLSWAGTRLEQAAHGLFPIHWSWRRLTLDDLAAAARRGELWQGRHGWAMAEIDEDTLLAPWLSVPTEEARPMVRALLDLAGTMGAARLEVMAPGLDWLSRALRQSGCEVHPLTVYGRAL